MMRCIQCHIPCDPWDHAPPCPAPFISSKAKYLRNYSDPHPYTTYIIFHYDNMYSLTHTLCPSGVTLFQLNFLQKIQRVDEDGPGRGHP